MGLGLYNTPNEGKDYTWYISGFLPPTKGYYLLPTLPETTVTVRPWKWAKSQKGNDHLPTIHFQVRKAVSFREGVPPFTFEPWKIPWENHLIVHLYKVSSPLQGFFTSTRFLHLYKVSSPLQGSSTSTRFLHLYKVCFAPKLPIVRNTWGGPHG